MSGWTLSAPASGNPPAILIGQEAGVLGLFFDSLFEVRATANIAPIPYTLPSITWNVTAPIVTLSSQPDESVTIKGTGVGQTTLSVTAGPLVNASGTIPVNVYRTIAVGCEDVQVGAGVKFNADGSYSVTSSATDSDLYSSMVPDSIGCVASGTPNPNVNASPMPTNALYFPAGGVFFPNGDDPSRGVPSAGPRGAYFSQVTTSMWQAQLTSLPYAVYLADIAPCYTPIQYPAPTPCPVLSDQVLLIKTRTGLFVKLLYIRPRPGYFAGLYQVAGPNGFAY